MRVEHCDTCLGYIMTGITNYYGLWVHNSCSCAGMVGQMGSGCAQQDRPSNKMTRRMGLRVMFPLPENFCLHV